MSSNLPINTPQDITAPTPQNTPLTHAPISTALSRPTVPDISEDAEPAEEPTSNVHEAVFGLVQGKLAGLIGRSSGYVESLPDGAKKTIEALKGVQVKQNDLQNQYKRECLELEKKACHPCSPLFFSPLLSIHHHPPLSPFASTIKLLSRGEFGPCIILFVARGKGLVYLPPLSCSLPYPFISRLRSEVRNDRCE
jgi:hypothetical protein